MSWDAARRMFDEILFDLNTLADEWDAIESERDTTLRELRATEEELHRVVRRFQELKSGLERLHTEYADIVHTLRDLVMDGERNQVGLQI